METSPVVGVSRVAMMRIVVVLPAPLGPTKALTRPGSMVKETPSRALVRPKVRVMLSTTSFTVRLLRGGR
jgi:hypothetical protein